MNPRARCNACGWRGRLRRVRAPMVEALLYAVRRDAHPKLYAVKCARCDSQDVTVGRER